MLVRMRCSVLKPIDPCPVCGADTALAEIEPHPVHGNFDIHGYLCDRCGPVKSLVVLRSSRSAFRQQAGARCRSNSLFLGKSPH